MGSEIITLELSLIFNEDLNHIKAVWRNRSCHHMKSLETSRTFMLDSVRVARDIIKKNSNKIKYENINTEFDHKTLQQNAKHTYSNKNVMSSLLYYITYSSICYIKSHWPAFISAILILTLLCEAPRINSAMKRTKSD